jgi:hypothetical protein
MISDLSLAAARLLQWALQPKELPYKNAEYRELLERFSDQLEFREVVKTVAAGLGLQIIGVPDSKLGMVVAAASDSVFAMRPSDYRANSSEDTRLLDGLIQVAIAATVYPRASDLLTDPRQVRNAVAVEEIELTLRQIVDRIEATQRGQPDPSVDGVYEAWRVYKHRLSARATKDRRAMSTTTSSMIGYALDFLCKQGCFSKEKGVERYRALWRYQVLVQEYAASHMHDVMKKYLPQGDA